MTHLAAYSDRIYRVQTFEIVGDYIVRVVFDDGTEQVIDFAPILYGPIFGPLRDLSLFNRVTLDETFGTLVWPNGGDVAPSVLHDWPEHKESIVQHRQETKPS